MNKSFALALSGTMLLSGCTGELEGLTGYTASMLCSKVFVGKQSFNTVYNEDLTIITDGAVTLATLDIDGDKKTTQSSALTQSATAIHRDGLGCTLVGETGEQALREQYIPTIPSKVLSNTVPWPYGDQGASDLVSFDYKGLQASVDYHFTEHGDYQIKTSSLAIAYQGQLIYEKYADGVSRNTPIYAFSLGKTIAAIFTGLLVKDNVLDIHTPIKLPEWLGDDREAITPHHLLTMTSGLEWSEVFADPSSDVGVLFIQEDMASFASDKPLVATPGTAYNYSTGNTMILSKVIKNALGGHLAGGYKALHTSLLGKLDMNATIVQTDASGSLALGAQPLIGTYDLARLGQFIMQNGQWHGEQIIPEDWISYMSTPVGLSTNFGFDYGAGLWLNTAQDGNAFFPSLPADTLIGYGLRGQFLIIIPSLQLVIVRTGNTMDLESLQFIPEMDKLAANIVSALPGD